MLTRIYRYRIRPGLEPAYLELQRKALALYRLAIEVDAQFFSAPGDPCQRTELLRFFDPHAPAKLAALDRDPAVLALFEEFKLLLDPAAPGIQEEELVCDPLSFRGALSHIELYCSDLPRSAEFWGWLLSRLGYREYQRWDGGVSYRLGPGYLVLVAARPGHDAPFHRCHPGLNHLAFHVSGRAELDALHAELRQRGVSILYPEKHPRSRPGEPYALYFECPERIKVELVAD